MGILEDFIANERIVNMKEFVKDYKYNRFSFETNSVADILNEINENGYDNVAKKYGVSVKYLKSTFQPASKMPDKVNKYIKLTPKIKNDINLLLDSGYGKIHISNIQYKNGEYINPEDIEKIIAEKNNKTETILQKPIIDIYSLSFNIDNEEEN